LTTNGRLEGCLWIIICHVDHTQSLFGSRRTEGKRSERTCRILVDSSAAMLHWARHLRRHWMNEAASKPHLTAHFSSHRLLADDSLAMMNGVGGLFRHRKLHSFIPPLSLHRRPPGLSSPRPLPSSPLSKGPIHSRVLLSFVSAVYSSIAPPRALP
jgi:hypothetical protein